MNEGETMRSADATWLAQALQASRSDTLATFAVFEAALGEQGLAVPYSPELNPPLWELGHVGWFQDWWLARFSERHRGCAADPLAVRHSSRRPQADALYDSSHVPHASRWQLLLPSAEATRADLAQGLADNLSLLATAVPDDDGLYFHRLCLAHEDMHHEAALYMAQALGLAVADERWQSRPLTTPPAPIEMDAGKWRLGSDAAAGFAFDNELCAHTVALPRCRIDAQVLRWGDYLPFAEAGGYDEARWWPGAAGAWRAAQPCAAPRYLRRAGTVWQHWRHGHWQALDLELPACNLSAFEAQAWCAWAGRRLPTEAEWERAALEAPDRFTWGPVWEWTASTFEPYPGFTPHPYRDYSAPWFGSRPVLRGASFATQPRLRHARYRNYFTPERNDVFAGFRSCAC